MKWTVAILIILGLLAAGLAVVLVNAVRAGEGGVAKEVEVIVATRTLPEMSVVEPNDITKKKVPRAGLTPGYLTDPTQAIKKVLKSPVMAGEMLMRGSFLTESEKALMAELPAGMRAVTVQVSGESATGLYPGCIVDVIATFRLRGGARSKGQALSTTLLERIQVLRVAGESVGQEASAEKGTSSRSARRGRVPVTLKLDTRQAEALQVAMVYGNISLTMRNPVDEIPVDDEATVLSETELGKLGRLLPTAVPGVGAQGQWGPSDANMYLDPNMMRLSPADANRLAQMPGLRRAEQLRRLLGGGGYRGGEPTHWEMTLIKGSKTEDIIVEPPKGESEGTGGNLQ